MSIDIKDEHNLYLFDCWYCGENVVKTFNDPSNRVFCETCKEDYLREKEETLEKYVALKIEVMYERSLRYMEKQLLSMHKYKEAAESVIEFAKGDPNRFASSHEMMAAMELIRNEIPIKMQYKVKRHRIDILIPSLKVALEIDGYMHQYKILKDSVRDVDLVNEFGVGWEVIRIPTKHIEQNLKQLVPAIKALYKEKQKLRKKNGGFIPTYFSKRDQELQEMIEKENS